MDVSTATLAVRLLGFAVVSLGAPLFFVALFRGLDFIALDGLAAEWAGGTPDASGAANSVPAGDGTVVCPRCGGRNRAEFDRCGHCQAPLDG